MMLFPLVLHPQSKNLSITIHGNHYFSQRELIRSLSGADGNRSPQRVHALDSAIVERYRLEGFFFARIDSVVTSPSSDDEGILDIYLSEGEQSVIARISFHGVRHFSPEEITSRFETAVGKTLQQATLEKDIDDLLITYENNGFPLAKIKVDSLAVDSLDKSRLTFALEVAEGPSVGLTEISVEGNATTRSNVVAREAYLQPGEPYNQEKVDRIRRRLERLGIFASVGEPQLYFSHDVGDSGNVTGGLSITVQEGNTNNFDGVVGYAPATQTGQSGYFTGNVFVSMRNLFGTARKAVVRWQRESPSTQELEASYNEPWVGGYPLYAGIGIFQRKQDSSYIKTRFDLRGDLNVTSELSLALTFRQESVVPSTDLNYFTVFESDITSLGGEIHYDTRDNLRSPTSGIVYATTYSRGRKKINGPAQYLSLAIARSFLVEQFTVDLESYVPTFRRQVVLLGFHGKKISSSQLEQSDLFQLGGTNSVRGYRENQFYGSQIVWSNVENRFLVGRSSSVFGFVDAGYFSRPADINHSISSQQKFLYGYGVGARIETSLGIFRVSFALGEGDGFSDAKIHFGIANDF